MSNNEIENYDVDNDLTLDDYESFWVDDGDDESGYESKFKKKNLKKYDFLDNEKLPSVDNIQRFMSIASTFENLTNSRIEFQSLDSSVSSCELKSLSDGVTVGKHKTFILNIQDPLYSEETRNIDQYVLFKHELAHIVAGTFKYKLIPNQILGKDYITHQQSRMVHSIWNVLEDQRVESFLGRIYMGDSIRFLDMRNKIGENQKGEQFEANIVNYLLAVRFNRSDELDKNSELYKDAVKALSLVEKLPPEGSIYLTKYLARKYLNGFNTDQIIQNAEDENNHNGYGRKNPDLNNDLLDENGEVIEETLKNLEKEVNMYEARITKKLSKLNITSPENLKIVRTEGTVSRTKSGENYAPKINLEFSNNLKKVLSHITEKNKIKYSDYGNEISISNYIKSKAGQHGLLYKTKKRTQKLTIYLSIDVSGSMQYEDLELITDMVYNIFNSTENNNNIKVICDTWAGNKESCGICRITNKKQASDKICHMGTYNGTPTHISLAEANKFASGVNSENKLFIFISDGYPNEITGNKNPTDICKKYVNSIKKMGFKVIPIFVSKSHIYGNSFMKKVFGSYIDARNFETVKDTVYKNFIDEVVSLLKRKRKV